jgi:hypothetical protein
VKYCMSEDLRSSVFNVSKKRGMPGLCGSELQELLRIVHLF